MIATLQTQRTFFNTGITKTYEYRIQQLKALKQAIIQNEEAINTALYNDLKKSKEEIWVTEIGIVITEINYAIRKLSCWMKPTKVSTNLLNMPSSSKIISEPLGVVLIISPWNYPFQLLLNPLVGAIAAGNCVVLKPSEFAVHTAAIMQHIIETAFAKEYISYHTGDGATVIPQMLTGFKFDHIFYTGSIAVGKIIYKMAAENLVPVTLELGGKSPCIIAADANIKVAAKRIAMTKFNNCGQMCVAPDYVLVHESVKDKFIEALQVVLPQFFTTDPSTCPNYGKIINEKQYDRLIKYLDNGTVVYGGKHNKELLYIEPTLLTHVTDNDAIMQVEIFGPILPILTYTTNDEAKLIIAQHPNPLALYIFTNSKATETYWMDNIAFGGGCINNASWHLTNHHLPFGGRGFSGTGAYHGKFSFSTFSHNKAIMKTPTWFDPSIKYPPFKGKLSLFKRIIN